MTAGVDAVIAADLGAFGNWRGVRPSWPAAMSSTQGRGVCNL